MKSKGLELLSRAAKELEESTRHIQLVIDDENFIKDDQPEGVGSAELENTITESEIMLSNIIKEIEDAHGKLMKFMK